MWVVFVGCDVSFGYYAEKMTFFVDDRESGDSFLGHFVDNFVHGGVWGDGVDGFCHDFGGSFHVVGRLEILVERMVSSLQLGYAFASKLSCFSMFFTRLRFATAFYPAERCNN